MVRKIAIIALASLVVLGVLGTLGGIKVLQIRKLIEAGKAGGFPPESVSTALVREEQWQGALTAIGSITAVQGVSVTTDLAGIVREIAFDSGAIVPKGALLIRLDTSSEEAQLRAMEAQVELAKINLDRERSLASQKMVSQSELDTAEATMKQNQANADAIRATIERKTIHAPFAGQLGIRQVNLGQFLDVGKPVVSLQALSPVYAEFTLPQQELARLKTGMPVRVATDAYPGRQFEGRLNAMNPDLDQSTRSVMLQATFDNPDQSLRPGMFARIEVLLAEQDKALVVPATAVLSAPFGDSVYVVETGQGKDKPGLTVRQQFVRVGRTHGDFVSIESGLQPGQRVVSAGAFKLRNGTAVIENNDVAPKASESPKPADS